MLRRTRDPHLGQGAVVFLGGFDQGVTGVAEVGMIADVAVGDGLHHAVAGEVEADLPGLGEGRLLGPVKAREDRVAHDLRKCLREVRVLRRLDVQDQARGDEVRVGAAHEARVRPERGVQEDRAAAQVSIQLVERDDVEQAKQVADIPVVGGAHGDVDFAPAIQAVELREPEGVLSNVGSLGGRRILHAHISRDPMLRLGHDPSALPSEPRQGAPFERSTVGR